MRAVCFDLDDTLYPYEQYVDSGFRAAADVLEDEFGVDLYEAFVASYEAGHRSDAFDRVLAANGFPERDVDDLVAAFHSRVGPLELYPGVRRLIEKLADDYRLAVITDGRNGHEKLDELGLADVFDAAWVSPERGVTKREPEPFLTTLEELGVDPSHATHVGDHPRYDVAVPNELGVRTVRVRQGRYADRPSPTPPSTEIDSIGAVGSSFD